MQTLQNRITSLVMEAPPEGVARVQAALASGASQVSPGPDLPDYLLTTLLRSWQSVGHERMPPQALATAIGTARAMKERIEADSPRLELVWTGPHSPANIQARTTASVLREMIDGARNRILVVSYDLTQGNGLSEGVIEALANAWARGCVVVMALHNDEENFNHVKQLWPAHLPLPRLLRWVGVPGDRMAKLHAKLVVADARDLLITSANLTFHGLEQNIEIGVRIRGRFAADVDRHFGNLEAEKTLVPYH
ncbi:MAG: DISARM system phospholipase D-like protein DrmC [Symbiobacteriia bacterium]